MTPWLAGLFVILTVLVGASHAAFAIDLSAGVLSQSHCKTTIGCAHHQVDVTATSFSSTATATNLAQNILTLAVPGPLGAAGKTGGPHALELDYELVNPSGQANTFFGPETWRTNACSVHGCRIFGLRWLRGLGLPPGASLPLPTPVCLDDGDCPSP